MLLVYKHVSVSCLSGVHVDDRLVCVLQWDLLDPRLDVSLNGKVQHLLDVLGRANGAAADLDAVSDKGKCVDRRKLSTIRCAVA